MSVKIIKVEPGRYGEMAALDQKDEAYREYDEIRSKASPRLQKYLAACKAARKIEKKCDKALAKQSCTDGLISQKEKAIEARSEAFEHLTESDKNCLKDITQAKKNIAKSTQNPALYNKIDKVGISIPDQKKLFWCDRESAKITEKDYGKICDAEVTFDDNKLVVAVKKI